MDKQSDLRRDRIYNIKNTGLHSGVYLQLL